MDPYKLLLVCSILLEAAQYSNIYHQLLFYCSGKNTSKDDHEWPITEGRNETQKWCRLLHNWRQWMYEMLKLIYFEGTLYLVSSAAALLCKYLLVWKSQNDNNSRVRSVSTLFKTTVLSDIVSFVIHSWFLCPSLFNVI